MTGNLISVAALGTAETVGGAKARKGEARGSQEKGQARSQCECVNRSQATPSGEFRSLR